MRLLGAIGIFTAGMIWLFLSSDTDAEARLRLTNIIVPGLIIMGAAGLMVALRSARRDGWHDHTEGLAAFSAMSLAFGAVTMHALIVISAQMTGHQEALEWLNHPSRLVVNALVVVSMAWAARWLTRWWLGEWGWALILTAWIAVVVLASPVIQRAMAWVYLTVRHGP